MCASPAAKARGQGSRWSWPARLTEPVLFGTLDWMLVYVDANLYDHIEKGGRMPPEHRVPVEHCAAFRDARLSGHLSAYLSLTDVEELLGDWDRPERRPAAVRGLRHARDLDRLNGLRA